MKILSVSLQNFASYKELIFDFADQGLTLIQGPNGAGKSTLADAIPWILFGKTAKGGTVDEVLSWPGKETCVGKLDIFVNNILYTITRSRGTNKNDLYYEILGASIFRGKDLRDTQRIIDEKLGTTYDLYLAGSYYHEFSQTAQFFSTTANNRRLICEQLVDLKLPIKLQSAISLERKAHKKSLEGLMVEAPQLHSNITVLQRYEATEKVKFNLWEKAHKWDKEIAAKAYQDFESGRDQVLTNQCNSCGTVLAEPKHVHNDSVNPYLKRLVELEQAINPYAGATKDYFEEINAKSMELGYLNQEILGLKIVVEELDLLEQVTESLRSTTIQNTIKFTETNTNRLLTDFFDAEIRVEFETQSKDKLEVILSKDGNIASFSQLSKGQRCLLKLCFGVSVMQAVQNHHGINFNTLWFDESLDGLSDYFKVKAYRLFEQLSEVYENMFVVEHSEALKSCFSNVYSVSLKDGQSVLKKD